MTLLDDIQDRNIKIGALQKRILLLLGAGLTIGLNPGGYRRIAKQIGREWNDISYNAIRGAIAGLYRNKMIRSSTMRNGNIVMELLDKGKKRTIAFNAEKMAIKKPLQWDTKWRIVLFDIPHARKKVRDAFRWHMRRLGFKEFQKSVFIHPYPCTDEVDFLIELYEIRKYVRQIIAEDIDNSLHMKKKFKI